ncbi:hypothetical protein TGAM01_v211071 [Trichoderma gamsii]|uniref:RNase III domain-containing protein n=1 Tax=Trichoderma gamsii TaxID=398673 RepID=A0A2P4Z703_9HYPO|nr:hypothetical protein TGAM01_v211071 [Trichoderma gamsii]PON20067.1 hypothetical protein TGAM01_v211071 [Trichoderma gamsii]
MATDADLFKVEQAFGYTFENKHLLQIALTSPGVERDNHHGNRLLARVGQAAMEMVIAQAGYESSATTATINYEQNFIDSKAQLSLAAEESGIVACIKLCQRSGPPSAHVKSQAMRAIIGAAWEDSDQSLGTVMAIIQKLKSNLLKPGVKIHSVSEDTAASPQSTIASSSRSMQQTWTPRSDFDGSDERPPSSSNSGLLHVAFELPVISDDLFTMQMLGTAAGSVYINALNISDDYIVPDVIRLGHLNNASNEFDDSFSDFQSFLIDEPIQCQPRDIISSKPCSSSLSVEGEHCSSTIISTTVGHEWVLAGRPGLEQNGPGNPRIMRRSSATSALMDKTFPELNKDSSEFKHKYDQIKRLEKLGRRLNMMTETFGEGILGLLQCSEADATFLKISDPMFLKPTDHDFREFLSLLDRTQRMFIYECSQSTTPILKCILDGTLKKTNLFPLELNRPEQILGLPKGSQSLLDALTYVL